MNESLNLAPVPPHVPAHLVYDFDHINLPEGETDAFAHWARLHDGRPPIFYTPHYGGHWVATRYEDIAHILETWQDFSSTHQTLPKESKPTRLPPSELDPPLHLDFRKLIAPFFTPQSIADLEVRARDLTIRLIDQFYPRGECEFAGEFALHMPIGLFMSIAGLPDKDRLTLLHLAEEIVRPNSTEDRLKAFATLFDYLRAAFAARRENPTHDALSALVHGRVDGGRPLTDDEMLGMASLMIAAGLDTVAGMMGFMIIHLARHPEQRRRLVENPQDIPVAVEELMRRHQISNLCRMVTHDLTYKGVEMKAGDIVLAPSSSAGLDPNHYPDPQRVDFDRADKKSLVFGRGPHQCIGAFLARTELKVFLTEWLKRIPDFAIKPGEIPLTRPGSSNTVLHLPIVWDVK